MTDTASLSRSQIGTIARALMHNWDYSNKPSMPQLRTAINRYCDDPAITATDRNRIRARLALMLDI